MREFDKYITNGLQISNCHFKVGTFDFHLSYGGGSKRGLKFYVRLFVFDSPFQVCSLPKFKKRRPKI